MNFDKCIKRLLAVAIVMAMTFTSLPYYTQLMGAETSAAESVTTTGNLMVSEEVRAGNRVEVMTAEVNLYQEGSQSDLSINTFSASQTIKEYIISQYERLSSSISVVDYNVSVSTVQIVIQEIINDNPQLFYVNGSFRIIYNEDTRMVYSITPAYNYDLDEIPARIEEFNSEAQNILECISSDMTDVEKALAVHDYMVINYQYEYENCKKNELTAESFSAYGIMTRKTGVCNAYALAYEYIMNNCLGIECSLVTSTAMNHAWNLVRLDGEYYHVDVTWDDPTWDRLGACSHDHFLASDARMQEILNHYGFVTGKATSTSYDSSFWTDVSSNMEYYDGSWYYIESDGDVMCNDFVAGVSRQIYTIADRWPVWGSYGSWIGTFSGLEIIDERIYYNTPTQIRSMTMTGSDIATVYAPSTTKGYIYGIAALDNVLYYVLETTCDISGPETYIPVPGVIIEDSASEDTDMEETDSEDTDIEETEPQETTTEESKEEITTSEVDGESTVDQTPDIAYRTHVQSYGWQSWVDNGDISGTVGQAKRLEAIQIQEVGVDNLGVRYKTHVQSYGWQNWVSDGELSGTSGQAKRLEAIQIELTGAKVIEYDIFYRVQAQTYGWLGWAKNGEEAGTSGQSKRLEAIQIVVLPKGETPAEYKSSVSAYIVAPMEVRYRTHVQSYGWQNWVNNGTMSGTSGEAKRLEAIQLQIANAEYSGGITYRTHVQSYGWQNWVSDGVLSGTSGESKRLEAIQIQLSGELAEKYDVYYRVHAQTYGWLGWAKNGESAGTSGLSKRLEGIEVVLVERGSIAPSSTANAYISK